MTFAQLIARLRAFVLPVEHAAESVVHFAEKELVMFDTKAISDALDRLKARPDQSATITALQGQVSDLTASESAKDAKIADLNSQLAAANSDIAELVGDLTQIQNTLLALAPDPNAPAQ